MAISVLGNYRVLASELDAAPVIVVNLEPSGHGIPQHGPGLSDWVLLWRQRQDLQEVRDGCICEVCGWVSFPDRPLERREFKAGERNRQRGLATSVSRRLLASKRGWKGYRPAAIGQDQQRQQRAQFEHLVQSVRVL